MPSLLVRFRRLLLDLPMRQKLLVALMATCSLPLLVVALSSLSYYLDYANRMTAGSLHDKLDIGSLVLDNAGIGLLNVNKRIAGDHALVMSLDLGLDNPVNEYLQTIQARQELDYAAILGLDGQVIAWASGPELPGISAVVLGMDETHTVEGISFWNAEGNSLVSLIPIYNTERLLLGYSCIAYRFGQNGGGGGGALLKRMGDQIGIPFFLVSAEGMVHVSPAMGGLILDARDLLTRLSLAGSTAGQTIQTQRGSWQAQSLALRDQGGNAVGVLGVALSTSELQTSRVLTLGTIGLVFLLALLLCFLVARWFAGFISRPIAAVAQGTRAIIEGNFDFRFEPQGHDEIGLMTEDFAIMTLQLRKLIQELGLEVEQHRNAESQIRVLNNQLELRVDERTQALSQSNQALTDSLELLRNTQKELIESEKMAALSHVVVGVAHELNTPIGNSLTAITYLEQQVEALDQRMQSGELSKQEFQKFVDVFREATVLTHQNLARTGKLVGFFKQMAVNLDEEPVIYFKPRDLIEEIIYGLAIQSSGMVVRMVNSVDPDVLLRNRQGALARVLNSLVENALHHAFTGQSAGIIYFESRRTGNWVELLIRDDGKGIPDGEIKRVFEPFYTTGRGKGHVGLGLSIVFNLVTARLGGTIQCRSEPGQGTTFVLRLPSGLTDREPA